MKKTFALLLSAIIAVSGCITPALAAENASDVMLESEEEEMTRRAEYISAYFDEPPVGSESDYTGDEQTHRGNVQWDGFAVDLTAATVVSILAYSWGMSVEDAASIGVEAANRVQTALEEYAPYSDNMDYEDTITVNEDVSTVTSEYRKHSVVYTLETGKKLPPVVFYEVRSWI